jgi:sugar porter (SP) family MFS transporter
VGGVLRRRPVRPKSAAGLASVIERHILVVAMAEKRKGFIYVVTFIAALSGLLFGYDTGVISGAILFVRQQFHLGSVGTEVVTSAVVLGAVIGAALGGMLSTRLGRRRTIIAAAAVFSAGAIVTGLAPSVSIIILGRLIVGATIGVMSLVGPMYIAEVAPAGKRGGMVSINQLAVTIGIVISYLTDYALASHKDWRLMFLLAVIPGAALVLGMWGMPFSPRWLMMRGKTDAARRDLQKIRGTENVGTELSEMQSTLATSHGAGLHDLLAPAVRRGLVVGIGLALLQQITGVNTVIYYAPMIFKMAGVTGSSASILATVGLGCVNVIFTLVSIFLVDRLGRRPLLLLSIAGMIGGLVLLALSLRHVERGAAGAGPIAGLLIYIAAFAIGLGPVFWLLISEIYPLRVRGTAMSMASVANWSANFVVSLVFLSLTHALGPSGAFLLFAAVGVIAWFFTLFLVPETKNRTLEQIERELGQKAGSGTELKGGRPAPQPG